MQTIVSASLKPIFACNFGRSRISALSMLIVSVMTAGIETTNVLRKVLRLSFACFSHQTRLYDLKAHSCIDAGALASPFLVIVIRTIPARMYPVSLSTFESYKNKMSLKHSSKSLWKHFPRRTTDRKKRDQAVVGSFDESAGLKRTRKASRLSKLSPQCQEREPH